MGNKRVQISSDFTSESEQLFERIEDVESKVTKVVQRTEPSVIKSSTTITTKPYTADTKASVENTKTKAEDVTEVKLNKGDYDTSQL